MQYTIVLCFYSENNRRGFWSEGKKDDMLNILGNYCIIWHIKEAVSLYNNTDHSIFTGLPLNFIF